MELVPGVWRVRGQPGLPDLPRDLQPTGAAGRIRQLLHLLLLQPRGARAGDGAGQGAEGAVVAQQEEAQGDGEGRERGGGQQRQGAQGDVSLRIPHGEVMILLFFLLYEFPK